MVVLSAKILEMTHFICVFGHLLGAWAHHKGLRRLKPCQYWRIAYWHCEFGKFVGMLISICWQFVSHGQMASLVSPAVLCIFSSLTIWKKRLDAFLCGLVAWCETSDSLSYFKGYISAPIEALFMKHFMIWICCHGNKRARQQCGSKVL